MFEIKTTRTTTSFGGFIANALSVVSHNRGLGLRVDPTDFGGENVPAGSIVGIEERAGIEYAVPFAAQDKAVLTLNDVLFGTLTGSSDTVAVITGGQIYGNRLPGGTPTAAEQTALGGNFEFIKANF